MSLPSLPTGGYDRADGQTVLRAQGDFPAGISGTPSPIGAITKVGSGVQQDPEFPQMERAEQATFQQRLKMTFAEAYDCLRFLPRGTFFTDNSGNAWRLLSAKIAGLRGNMATLEYTAESISFDTPPDEFRIVPTELGIDILKHPRYAWAISPTEADNTTKAKIGDIEVSFTDIKNTIIRSIQSYRDSPYYPSADTINGVIQNNILSQIKNGKLYINYPNNLFDPTKAAVAPKNWDGTNANRPTGNFPYYLLGYPVNLTDPDDPIAIAMAAAKEIISKLWRQEDTPYQVGYKIEWKQYFFAPQFLNPGGYRENPLDVVPEYFTNPNYYTNILPRGNPDSEYENLDTINASFTTPGLGSNTIFDNLALINPQSYSDDRLPLGEVNYSALRLADEMEYNRTWFCVTHSWLIATIGQWDKDLYHEIGVEGPQNANDFSQLV